jgi:UDP:flavonoid glycosyltransferase YjiC (YdhE family)
MPIVGDQPDNAARIIAKGAGIRLRSDAQAPEIRAALNRILLERQFRESARRLGGEMSGIRAEVTAADELESIAGTVVGRQPSLASLPTRLESE